MGKKTILSITVIFTAVVIRQYASINKRLAPILDTNAGKLQGIISTSRDGRDYAEYLGIPFAKPPLQDLRYEPPEPADPWVDIRDATSYGYKCLQIDLFTNRVEGDEDCLTLNVHAPKVNLDSSEKAKLLPVMVWFHGGLFIFGSSMMYRADYFLDEDVILVTVNYRLASFGFLNTGDSVVRGNMGLKDQNMALQWVKKNIEAFGGDPNFVTIFGESAGGASVHYQMLSPMSKGLFHKAIAQSGLATMPWALYESPKEQANRFAQLLNCSAEDTKTMVACLKKLPATELISGHAETVNPLRELISVFVPTIELNIPDGKTFLSEHPKDLIAAGKVAQVPLLTGLNSEEGLINSAVIMRNESLHKDVKQNWNKVIPRLLYLKDNADQEILQKINTFYHIDAAYEDPMGSLGNLTNMFTDRFWGMGFKNGITAQLQNHSSPVYLYYYTYKSQFTLTTFIMALKGETHPIVEILSMKLSNWVKQNIFSEELPHYGVCHGDEVGMQFYVPMMASVSKEDMDYEFSKTIVRLFASFAKTKTGVSQSLEFQGKKWNPQSRNQPLEFMKLDSSPEIIKDPFKSRVEFWNSLGLL